MNEQMQTDLRSRTPLGGIRTTLSALEADQMSLGNYDNLVAELRKAANA